MDRMLYKRAFLKGQLPDWICPTCRKGVLRLTKDSFRSTETKLSREAREHEHWDPDWIRYAYSCMLECSNEKCSEGVASVGEGTVDLDVVFPPHGEPEQVWADFFRPLFFEPPLAIIELPAECPASVSEPLTESFRTFFSSPASSANSIRVALEALLSEVGVKRFVVKNGKRQILNLHTRITLVPAKHADLRDLLIAIKWLGNAGSHYGSSVSKDDVMDAYELIDHVLQEMYAQKSKKAKALAKQVNKSKGPKK